MDYKRDKNFGANTTTSSEEDHEPKPGSGSDDSPPDDYDDDNPDGDKENPDGDKDNQKAKDRDYVAGGAMASNGNPVRKDRDYSSKNSNGLKPKLITVKVYVNKDLWNAMRDEVGWDAPLQEIRDKIIYQFDQMLKLANGHLKNLDDGGYKVDFDQTIHRLESSDVKMSRKYVDRLDFNATKRFNKRDLFSHTFIFQQAVEKMKNRNDVDLRILLIPSKILTSQTEAAAEEHCICDPDWFGCVLVMGIKEMNNFKYHGALFAHELGHNLGFERHDDEYYHSSKKDTYIMWSSVSASANVWSEMSRKAIRDHNKDCLKREN